MLKQIENKNILKKKFWFNFYDSIIDSIIAHLNLKRCESIQNQLFIKICQPYDKSEWLLVL